MKNFACLIVGIFVAGAVLGFASKMVMAQDAAKVASKNYKVLLENDRVRVLEYQAKPGEKAAMHSHPDHLGYLLSAGKAKFTSADGKAAEMEVKSGQVLWLQATTHEVENVGTSDLRVLIVELKEAKKEIEKEVKK